MVEGVPAESVGGVDEDLHTDVAEKVGGNLLDALALIDNAVVMGTMSRFPNFTIHV